METTFKRVLSGTFRIALGYVLRPTQAAKLFIWLPLFVALPASQGRAGYVYDIDLTGWETYGDFTSPRNSWTTITLFPYATISKVEWIDLEVISENGSFSKEFIISVNDSSRSSLPGTYWEDSPYKGTDAATVYQGSGSFSTPGLFGSGPFNLLSDGILLVYIFEDFDDFGSDAGNIRDAVVTRGTLRITAVPEPSSFLMLGATSAVAVVLFRRKSRRHGPSSQPIVQPD